MASEAQQWKREHQMVPLLDEKGRLAVHHEKNLHACGDDPQGPPAGMPKAPLATVVRLELVAAKAEIRNSSPPMRCPSTDPTSSLRQVRV